MKLPAPDLCVADDATFWPWYSWPDFASWPDRCGTVVVLPMAGLADWGLGGPLDAEERVLMPLLREAALRRPVGLPLLVSPLRFVLGPEPGCAFAVDPDVACALIEEVCASVADAGFRRIAFFNASPWNEELCKAVGRDLRVARGLQMACVNLSALGIDFHPVRGGDRSVVKVLLAAQAENGSEATVQEGRAIVEAAAARLVSLLVEIKARPPLAHGGALLPVSAP